MGTEDNMTSGSAPAAQRHRASAGGDVRSPPATPVRDRLPARARTLHRAELISAVNARGVACLRLTYLSFEPGYVVVLRQDDRCHRRFLWRSLVLLHRADHDYTRLLEAELEWLDLSHNPVVRRLTTALLEVPADVRESLIATAR